MPRSFVFVLVLLMTSLGFNVFLAREVRSLRPAPQHDAMLGKHASAMEGSDLEGRTVQFNPADGQNTLLYFIDPDCRWCKANASAFHALAASLKNTRVVVVTRRAEHLGAFLEETGLGQDQVLVVPSEQTARDLNLVGTPQTFYIDGSGTVQAHWIGSYGHQNKPDIEKRFHVILPAVPEPV